MAWWLSWSVVGKVLVARVACVVSCPFLKTPSPIVAAAVAQLVPQPVRHLAHNVASSLESCHTNTPAEPHANGLRSETLVHSLGALLFEDCPQRGESEAVPVIARDQWPATSSAASGTHSLRTSVRCRC